ncbi:MAG: PEGA domain-containing protein, partial [Terriglobia bacterium]
MARPAEDQLFRPSTGARPKPEPRFRSSGHAVPLVSIPGPPPVGAPAGKGRRWVLPVAAALVVAAGMAAWQLEIRRHVTSINLAAAEHSWPVSNRGSAGSLNSKANSSSGPPTKQSAVASPSASSVSGASTGELSSPGQHSENPSRFTSPPRQVDKSVRQPAGETLRQRFIRNGETVAAFRQNERPAAAEHPFSPRQVENQWLAGLIVNTAPGAAVFLDGKRVGTADHEGELTVYNLKPGAHGLRVALAGYPDIEYSVQSAPGGTSIVTAKWTGSDMPRTSGAGPGNSNRSPAEPFTETFAVTHERVIGGGKGTLVIRNDSIQFRTEKGKDSFNSPLNGINWGKKGKGEFFLRLANGRTYT